MPLTAYSAPFHGISKHSCGSQMNLTQSDFTPIAAQQTLEYDIDIADLYDLSIGAYNVSIDEYLPYANEGSIDLTGRSFPLLSAPLPLLVDSKKPAQRTELKRNTLQSDCSPSQSTAVSNANKACARMATAAAEAASSGSEATFQEFFTDTSPSTRSHVAAQFRKVAAECSSAPGGTGTSFCTDQKRECGGGLLAYTYWQDQANDRHFGTTYYCPIYFETLAPSDAGCNDQSQASNTLHETTHAVLGTRDIAYGPENVRRLSGSDALRNADSYTYYAIGELIACSLMGLWCGLFADDFLLAVDLQCNSNGGGGYQGQAGQGQSGSSAGSASPYNGNGNANSNGNGGGSWSPWGSSGRWR